MDVTKNFLIKMFNLDVQGWKVRCALLNSAGAGSYSVGQDLVTIQPDTSGAIHVDQVARNIYCAAITHGRDLVSVDAAVDQVIHEISELGFDTVISFDANSVYHSRLEEICRVMATYAQDFEIDAWVYGIVSTSRFGHLHVHEDDQSLASTALNKMRSAHSQTLRRQLV